MLSGDFWGEFKKATEAKWREKSINPIRKYNSLCEKIPCCSQSGLFVALNFLPAIFFSYGRPLSVALLHRHVNAFHGLVSQPVFRFRIRDH